MLIGTIIYFCLGSFLISWSGCQANLVGKDDKTNASASFGKLKTLGPLNTIRSVHTATRLNDGRVLIAGGMNNAETALDNVEIFDPKTGKFYPAPAMKYPRVGHSAVLLKDGTVLLAGGYTNRKPSATAEIFDPQTNQFEITGNLKIARGGHTATLLDDGRVLVAGSENGEKDAEIYDPKTRKFTATGNLNTGRFAHTATLLKNGEVLLTGGSGREVTGAAEIFDPQTGAFRNAGQLAVPRYKHSAVLLDDGSVLVVGGSDDRDWNGQIASAEIYDVRSGKFKTISEMNVKRFKIATALVKLPDGRVVVAGGNELIEIFDPKTGKFSGLEEKTGSSNYYTTVTLLDNNRILIIDGYDRSIKANGRAFLLETTQP
ncbi:hypothetical protein H6S82_02120 [Planktothrix sp. FACHB-1355]|uniref:kelch repeat-containing protein n=1 Tax=Planktothrix sp. FACHB-1355 TaxID=2692854 RepID=UPI00168AB6CE|nr:kelch repeat-containing protein [Planktothrix sp. FACHB-1355]MBD3557660.1 hypothetical protein [Planktothrix sp. FACHB-1355]